MAERDEVGRALGRLDARDAGGGDDVALGRVARRHRGRRLRRHPDDALRHGPPLGYRLSAHVDHSGAALVVEMGELLGYAAAGVAER